MEDYSSTANKILVSIIIPIYNSENYISDTIKSCLEQSYTNIEIILINDGSTDRTEEIIMNFLSDNRIKYFKTKNKGGCEARNFGISHAGGMLFQFLDHDDVIDSEKLLYQVESYQIHGDEYLYSGDMGTISDTKKTIDEGFELYKRDFAPAEYFKTSLNQFGKYITTGAWLVPLKLIKSTHGWDPKSGLNDDGEYFMRVILASAGIIYVKEAEFYFRRDVPNSLSKSFGSKEVYSKWLYSYISYADNFLKKLDYSVARELGWRALSVFYCNCYPKYPDLLGICKTKMSELGYSNAAPYGGSSFITLSKYLGIDLTLTLLSYKKRMLNMWK